MKWSDIKFKNHLVVKGGIRAKVVFPNGEWCSIVGGSDGSLYGDGVTTFEIMSSSTEKNINTVKGWLSKKQVMSHLRYLKNKEVA